MKNSSLISLVGLTIVVALAATSGRSWAQKNPVKPKLSVSIKPQHLADALRAVVAAHREVYTRWAAQHAEAAGWPNPCEMFRQCSQAAAGKGIEFSYVLRSLQPIRPANAPETALEKKGLEYVTARPNAAYYQEELLGGRWYFTAVYPDVAVHASCARCHNQHPASPKKDYQAGQVMGGVVVRVALEL